MIKLPEDLEKVWYTRQYYGTVAHNAKAVYQRYMGWYDANPVNLHPLTPTDSAKKYVEYMGDTGRILEMARKDFENGEYQWVAEITNVLVFADPENTEARQLCADALEQLGYQAEAGTWRSAYLTGAKELRGGAPSAGGISSGRSGDMLRAMSPAMVFDYLGICIDANAAQNINMIIDVNVVGDDSYLLTVKSGIVLYQKGSSADNADVSIALPKAAVALLLSPEGIENELVKIEGDKAAFLKLYDYIAVFDPFFNIVEP